MKRIAFLLAVSLVFDTICSSTVYAAAPDMETEYVTETETSEEEPESAIIQTEESTEENETTGETEGLTETEEEESEAVTESEEEQETATESEEQETVTESEEESETSTELQTESETETLIETLVEETFSIEGMEVVPEVDAAENVYEGTGTLLAQENYYNTGAGYPLVFYARLNSVSIEDSTSTEPEEVSDVVLSIDGEKTDIALEAWTSNYSSSSSAGFDTTFSFGTDTTISAGTHEISVTFKMTQKDGDIVSYSCDGTANFVDEQSTGENGYTTDQRYVHYCSNQVDTTIPYWTQQTIVAGDDTEIESISIRNTNTKEVVLVPKRMWLSDSATLGKDPRYTNFYDGDHSFGNTDLFPDNVYTKKASFEAICLTEELTEGNYDVVCTFSDGTTAVFAQYYYITGRPVIKIIEDVRDVYNTWDTTRPNVDNRGDYVTCYIGGLNLDESTIPTFYDETATEAISTYVEDGQCGYEYIDQNGAYYRVKKVEGSEEKWRGGLEDTESYGNLNVKIAGDDVIYPYVTGTTIEGFTGTLAIKAWYVYRIDYIASEKYADENCLRLYLSEGFVSTGEEVTIQIRDTPREVDATYKYEEKVTVRDEGNGKYILFKSDSQIYKLWNINGISYDYWYSIESEDGECTVGVAVTTPNEDSEFISSLEVVAKSHWEIHPVNNISQIIYSGTTGESKEKVLSEEQMKALIGKGAFLVCVYSPSGKTSIRKVVFFTEPHLTSYKITYELDGGTNAEANPSTYTEEDSFTLQEPAKEGYKFLGWYADNTFKTKVTGIEKGTTGDKIFYAKWEEIKTYAVIYHMAGGINNENNISIYTADTESFTLLDPVAGKDGYYFAGWYKEAAYKNKITTIKKGTNKDTHVYAKWLPYTYTIHFDGNGATGGNVKDQKVKYGAQNALNANAYKKTGYVFKGWSLTKGSENVEYQNKQKVSNLVVPQNDNEGQITLYAVWDNTFEISYELNNGQMPENTQNYIKEYTYGKAYTLPVPVREGYTFAGWYKDAALKQKLNSIKKTTSGDLILYAKWTANNYKITFVKNAPDASGKMTAQSMKSQVAKELSANKFVRKGFKFAGWNTVAAPTEENAGTAYADKALVDIVADKNNMKLTLYAQWEETDYTITYETDGGIVDASFENYITTYQYGHKGGYSLPVPEKTGYTFAGWCTDSSFKKKITTIKENGYGDLVLYAKWTANYKIVFHENGSAVTGTMKTQNMKYEKAGKISKNVFKNNGYAFMGWSTSPEGNVIYKNAEKLYRPDQLSLENNVLTLHLYAVWENTFSVTYHLNDGSFEENDATVIRQYTYGTGIKKADLSKIVPVREGYTFGGWYKDAKYKSKVTQVAANASGDMELYAKWKGKAYKVHFNANNSNAKGKMSLQSMTYGTEKALTKNSFKVAGYKFIGWGTSADGEVVYTDKQKIAGMDSYEAKIELYAVWEKEIYSITYKNMDGVDNPNPVSYSVDHAVVLKEPERIGYTFLGWYTDKSCKKKVTGIKEGTVGNKTYYAKWKLN